MKRPVSVYLSKVAVQVPLNLNGLCAQLEALAIELERRMTACLESGSRPEERNPVFAEENFNDRWPKDDRDMKVFRDDLRHLGEALQRARRSEFSSIRKIFDDLFGERVTEQAVRGYLDRLSGVPAPSNYERGKGFVAAPALLLPAAASTAQVSKAPAHRFHAGFLTR